MFNTKKDVKIKENQCLFREWNEDFIFCDFSHDHKMLDLNGEEYVCDWQLRCWK